MQQSCETTIDGVTADAVVSKYIELRNFVSEETKAFKARMKVYTDAMETLEGAAAQLMKLTGQTALSTEHGTAFPVHKLSVTCEDRELFFAFVRERQAWHFLTSHVAREAVEAYMLEFEGQLPPGIKTTAFIEIQFRKV